MWRGARRSLWLLAGGMMLAGMPATAQERWQPGQPADPYRQTRPQPQPQPTPVAPGGSSDLRRNLATVGTDPNNVSALVDSGRAALAMSDAQAALTFFSRADEVAPRDARIKAGMASAMTQLGQPRAALTLFAEARALGAPELEIASDRGLAHDLLGDPRSAQRDYASVLTRRDHDETRRRLALSLAISGQREPALRLLEPQVRRNDRAGWRTQAFVLALTGDTAGAARVASGTGPIGTAEAMAPFLARLPGLSPAQRAMAVHLGVFPSDGRAQYAANIDTTPDPGALALAGGPARPAPVATAAVDARRDERPGLRRQQRSRSPVERAAVSREPERRQVASAQPQQPLPQRARAYSVPGPSGELRMTQVARSEPRPEQPAAQQTPTPPPPVPSTTRFAPPTVEQEPAAPPAAPAAQERVPPTPAGPPADNVDPAVMAGVRPGDMIAAPGFSMTTPQPVPPSAPVASEQRSAGLGDLAIVVNDLRDGQGAAAPPPRQPSPAPPPPAPAQIQGRHWVQIAGNIQRASMAGELRRLRGRAPALLNGMQAWTASGDRLLVGPFGSARDAQAFVNQLRPRGVTAVAWSSGAGQTVERLAGTSGTAQAARATPERRPATATAARGRPEPQRNTTAARGSRSEETRAGTRSGNGRGRTETARTGTNARDARGSSARDARAPTRSGSNARETGRAAPGRDARTPAANSRSNRTASTVERRGNDARTARNRSAPEQRPAPRGRRSN